MLNLLLLIVPAALLGVLAYRLWRRLRYGAAVPTHITTLAPLCGPDVSEKSARSPAE
jgi:hypothetical protein